jgi:RHS repeat-associated protein
VTQPYSATVGQTTSPTAPATSITYDPLGRKAQTTDAGGQTVTLAYSQNDTYQTVGPAPTGEHTKQKQFEYDGLGRLTSVCEITGMTGSGTCRQTSAQTGFWTEYTYNVLGDLTGVTQNAQSGSSQTRSFTYDGLGRMTSETDPESGTQTYAYDTDSTCGTSSGDMVKRTDQVGNTVCYAYDALHRNTSVTYSGPYAANTPNKYFVYDSATVNGVAMSNAKTRIAEAFTATCSTCSKLTDIGISYTKLGQPSDVYESTQHSGGYYHVNQTYWANGAVNQLSNLAGLPTITYNVDGEGRVYSVSASSGQNPVTGTIYNVASRTTQVNFGSLDSDAFTYDPNTNRMSQYKFNVNGQSVIGNLGWNPDGSLATLGITDSFNSVNAQSCSYSSDDLSRIASANCGTGWSQTFLYDAFGNISKNGSMSFLPTYSYLTNRMTQIGSSTPTYDSNGNVTNDTAHTYTWNAAGKAVTIDGVGVAYDALNRMVEQNRSGAYKQIVYSPTGAKLAIMNGQALTMAFVPLPAGSMAVYNSSGLAYYRHSDWVGSSRFASTPLTRAMYFDGAYAPFGEPYAQAGTADLSFTGMNQDTVVGLYDFPAREYGIQGRWPAPDPAGLAAVTLTNPQSFNRYAYVSNRPLTAIDPSGMRECISVACEEGAGGGGAGGGAGGGLNNDNWVLGNTGYTVNGLPVSQAFARSMVMSGSGAIVAGSLAGATRSAQIGILSNPVSAILGQIIPGWGSIGSPIIDNFHNDGNGNIIGDGIGDTLCGVNASGGCDTQYWNGQQWQSTPICSDGPCINSSAQQIGSEVGQMPIQTTIFTAGAPSAAALAVMGGATGWSAGGTVVGASQGAGTWLEAMFPGITAAVTNFLSGYSTPQYTPGFAGAAGMCAASTSCLNSLMASDPTVYTVK